MMYRKKPVEVEAIQTYVGMPTSEIMDFVGGDNLYVSNHELYIPTLEGDMRINAGDWIVKGIKGEFYPCKPDIFEATYEVVK
jgi:hypothetical protein